MTTRAATYKPSAPSPTPHAMQLPLHPQRPAASHPGQGAAHVEQHTARPPVNGSQQGEDGGGGTAAHARAGAELPVGGAWGVQCGMGYWVGGPAGGSMAGRAQRRHGCVWGSWSRASSRFGVGGGGKMDVWSLGRANLGALGQQRATEGGFARSRGCGPGAHVSLWGRVGWSQTQGVAHSPLPGATRLLECRNIFGNDVDRVGVPAQLCGAALLVPPGRPPASCPCQQATCLACQSAVTCGHQ